MSSRWQKESTLPESVFEEIIATQPWNRLTQANILRAVDELANREIKKNKVNTDRIQGLYDVIVIDPPWPVEKIAFDRRYATLRQAAESGY